MWSRVFTTILIALVIGAAAFLGTLLSRSHESSASRARRTDSTRFTKGPAPPRQLYGKIEAPRPGQIYWGAFRLGAPYRKGLITSLEREVGSRPAVLMWYQEWDGRPDFPVADATWLVDNGIIPMVTWEPWKPPAVFGTIVNDQPRFSLARIADGDWDGYITRYAEEIKRFGGPVMLRPMHEMDGYWYPWSGTVQTSAGNSPAEYVRAWRHIWQVFQNVGATNVTWVWSVNHLSVPDTPENQVQNYWPGGRYVDWIGFSGFNWGTSDPRAVWDGFDAVERARYLQLVSYGKPIALTEMGAPEVGGDKAAWIRDSFRAIFDRYPKLYMVIWYDKQDSALRRWQIDSSPASLTAFRQAIADPRVLGADSAIGTAIPWRGVGRGGA